MKTAINESRKARGLEDMPANQMLKLIREKSEPVGNRSESFCPVPLNEGFSGGEKKTKRDFSNGHVGAKTWPFWTRPIPGLDIDALRIVANGVNKLRGKGQCHYSNHPLSKIIGIYRARLCTRACMMVKL